LPFIIGSPCIDVRDRSCIEECPVDCIYEGERKLYINPSECIDCGACMGVCPVDAISMDRRTAPEEQVFIKDNRDFFQSILAGRDKPIGNLGGARPAGPLGIDTPLVAAFAVQG
jgi:NAD-dependent dihydropyrimidine dehydrogenase PreA subunit